MAAKTFVWTYQTHVTVPPATAYAYVSDLSRHSEWSGTELRIEADAPGPVVVGSTFHSVGKTAGLPFHSEVVITELTPPDRLAFVARGIDGEFLHEFTFRSDGDGTLIERHISTRLPRVVGMIVKSINWPLLIRPMNLRAMDRLKKTLERAPSGAISTQTPDA
ncbi:MAG TPA: SRPBCC family protein [Ktedonobacterales bacterium]|nr:SRPBCC family protein [Ktedonobacterales bacterium]